MNIHHRCNMFPTFARKKKLVIQSKYLLFAKISFIHFLVVLDHLKILVGHIDLEVKCQGVRCLVFGHSSYSIASKITIPQISL